MKSPLLQETNLYLCGTILSFFCQEKLSFQVSLTPFKNEKLPFRFVYSILNTVMYQEYFVFLFSKNSAC